MLNLDLINDCLGLIGVLPEGVSSSAEQADLGLRELNTLVDEWADDGIIVNWSSQSTLSEVCSLMGLELQAVKYNLSIRLCPHFGRDPSQSMMFLAAGSYLKLQRIQMVNSMEPVTLSLPIAEAGITGSILTDD